MFILKQAINEKILSMEYHNCHYLQILTVDSQFSLANGVIVLVTGNIVGNDKVRRKFTQTFFLAPQEKGGYFVLNDIFKFVDDNTNNYDTGYVAEDTSKAPLTPNDGAFCNICFLRGVYGLLVCSYHLIFVNVYFRVLCCC